MEVKPGYKKTEVGVIPQEWNVAALGALSVKVGSGITPTGGQRVYRNFGRPFMRSQNVGWGDLLLDDVAFIDDSTHSTFADTEIHIDDVFLNITGASIGRSAVADSRLIGGNVNQHVCIIRADQDKLVPRFLNMFLLSTGGQKQIDSFQAGGNRQGLNFRQVRSMCVPLPPTKSEQRAIAAALSDVDALLDGLDRLISKKRDLKQAAMQQLLTSQTRLPGFHDEWDVWRLSEHFRIYAGGDVPKHSLSQTQSDSHPYPIFANALQDKGLYGYTNDRRSKADSLTITARGYLGHAEYRDQPFFPIVRLLVLEPIGQLDARFTTYAVNDRVEFAIESTGVPQLTAPQVGKYSVAAPPTLQEQRAIAAVLSDIDAELAALEARRDKTRLLKQAMMQELLTGKTRLVPAGAAHA